MKKTRTANLHHLYHEPLPENLKLTPKVEVDNVHQRQTTDVYEHALTITAWQQIYDQLHPGKFHGEFTEILLDDIQVFREYTGLALRQSCLVWPNSFWFGIPATRGEQGFIGSQCLGSAEIATRPGGTEFELSTPDDYTILGVVLSEDVITRQANFLHNPDRVLHMLRSQSALEVKEQHKAALWGFVQQALATFCENPENLHQPAVRKVLGDNLLMAMGAMLAMLMQRADRTADDRKQRDDGRGASAIILDVFGWLSLLALCAGFWFMNGYDDTMYHGGYLVAAILGALALAGAIRGVSLPRVLGCAPLRYLGSRSYSLYLMHYPLLQFMNPATRTEALPWWGWLIEAAVIWTATEAFYQLVEASRMYEPTPRSRHARASVVPSGRLRPGSWVMAALGIVTVAALTWAPVNWEQIAHDRMIQLRPELAEPAKPLALPKPKSIEKPSDDGTTSNNATTNQTNDDGSERNGDSAKPASPSVAPIAEKVPDNLDASKYHYDPNTGSCNADIMMIGDSVTSGTKDAIQAAFPNGYINGKPNRQMPQAVSVFQQATTAGHSGSVIIYGLGTNGIIRNEQVVQQLIDLAGGKPVYFVTIRMPYPNQEKNNNSMMRAAASHNGNVGIIDWYKYSEGHGEYLYDDGIHPNMTGAYAYATMLRQAVCGQ